jgi:short-subunit dehydrogenase
LKSGYFTIQINTMKQFTDKIAVVTGAGSGIGKEVALQLAAKGAFLVISDVNNNSLLETASAIGASACESHIVDVGNAAAVFAFAEKVLQKHGHIDILVNNAGFALGKISFRDIKMEDYHKIVNVNLWGVINHTKAFLEALLTRPEAHIVNISSVFGIIGVKEQVPYCTTKFAVRGFTEALRMELRGSNVSTTCVHPGGIDTNIVKNGIHYETEEKVKELVEKFHVKAGRTSPKEAARQIIEAIRKKKEKLLIGLDAKAIDQLARTFPVGYTAMAEKIFDSMM